MKTSSAHRWLDIVLTALAPMIWGSTYIVSTELLPPDRPFTAALLRTLPAGLLLVVLCRNALPCGQWRRLWLLSALNIGAFQALLFVAAYRLPGGLAAVMGAVQPLIVMLLAWGWERQTPGPMAVIGAVTGVLGMAVLLISPATVWDPLGIAAALGGAGCMATGTYLNRRWRSDLPLLAMTGWQLLLGGVMLLPVACLIDPPLPALPLTAIAGYVYLSLLGALLAYVLWFRGINRLSPVAVSSLGLLSPITAVVLGWWLLDQQLRGSALLGMLIVLASIALVQWSNRPPPARPAPASSSSRSVIS
ncbi:EamA family transporter [Pokkaliibacter plantistimulans]|uniref:EamA family transporter n=1 Tax=Proteobacteria bacterium 228 TaxID=2083153 RepID=A0A2S5KRE9_9PROT|nr:EamA family transporter [Pokkaliibacter plantistimulans]PPC77431.1 EamA family transporter [Pokkaliibacter plantistimulans]